MDAAGAAVAVQLVGFGVAVLVLVVATVLCARHRRSDEGIGVRPLSTYKPSTGTNFVGTLTQHRPLEASTECARI